MTPIRKLEGVTYWVIDDPEEIRRYVRSILRKEWEADFEDDGFPPKDWLTDLLARRWTLRILSIPDIHGSEYLNSNDLARRRAEMKRGIERYGQVIWPIVVRKEEHYLADGYCRYTTLKEIGVKKLYAYVGTKEH